MIWAPLKSGQTNIGAWACPRVGMHCCLLIPEIACLICTQFEDVDAKKSLAALAQTCLALREPALDALWYELDDLLPLVKCMPHDLLGLDFTKTLVHLFSTISLSVADVM
jgi:hypothetical protein